MGCPPDLDGVSDMESPSGKCTCFGLDHRTSSEYGNAKSVAAHAIGFHDDAIGIEICNVKVEPHPEGVHPVAGLEHQRTFEMI